MSYIALEQSLGFKKALPVTEDWSAAADFLEIISGYCLQNRPKVIVECSSGTSSLVLARCCQINGQGRVYSLENGEQFVAQTRQQLDDFSLSSHGDVIYAPLKEVVINENNYQWYEPGGLPAIDIDLLVIDGPPGYLQKHSRYPALPLLHKKLAKHCAVFLDDASRTDEQEITERWLKEFPEFKYEYIDNDRGCGILKR